ncbi:hypothetical protein AYO40_05655 [Planctomycetaceae bacterium SCGC AG-212-D15]|nr:hypothetical protein AYO40_05655 [Planctomycetaceae bacterium SCGC AG-212-D15]
MMVGIFSGCAWFLTFLVCHLALFHWRPLRNRFKAIARIFMTAALGHGLTALVLTPRGPGLHREPVVWVAFISGWLVMACLFVLYMPFFFSIGTSLSIQTMILVERSANGRAAVEDLREAFASKQLVAGRLETMVANGYLVCEADRYRVTAKGRLVAAVFGCLKRAWRLGAGG